MNTQQCRLAGAAFFAATIFLSSGRAAAAPVVPLYLQVTMMNNPASSDTISISNYVNYPFSRLKRQTVVIYKNKPAAVVRVNVESLTVSINFTNIHIAPGDTIRCDVDADGKVAIQSGHLPLHYYVDYLKNPFYVRIQPPFQYLKQTPDVKEYFAYCALYSKKEKENIDSVFGLQKPALKKYLTDKSDYDYIANLAHAFRKLPYSAGDSLFFVSAVRRLGLLQGTPAFINASYRLALGDFVEVAGGMSKQPASGAHFNKLLATAGKHLKGKVYEYFLLSTLNRIANIAEPGYDEVSRKIYTALLKADFTAGQRAEVAERYKLTLVLSRLLHDFAKEPLVSLKGESKALQDVLKGKKLYLFDFWASWCAPCIEEFPALKNIAATFPDVQVISISIDKNKAAWLRASAQHPVGADNYLVPDLEKSRMVRHYQIRAIPRFMLFDGAGKCIAANAAPPSSEHFKRYLRQLLSE